GVAVERGGAATSGTGELGPDYVRATLRDLGAGTFPDRGIPVREPSPAPPYVWARTTDPRACVELAEPWPDDLAAHLTPRPTATRGGARLVLGSGPGDHPDAWLLDDVSLAPPSAHVIGPLVWDVGMPTSGDGDVIVVPWCPTPGIAPPWDAPVPVEVWQETPL